MIDNEDLRMAIYQDLLKLASENKLNSLEKPKQITLLSEPFTVENDLLTPTLKLKRNVAKIRFESEIKKMYESPVIEVKKKE